MAYEGNGTCFGRQNGHQCNQKSDVDAQTNISISTVISKSCVVVEDLQNLSFGPAWRENTPRKSYPTDRNDSFPERDHIMNSDPLPPIINDHSADSGQSYGTLSIDSMNTDAFFEMPSAGYAPCSLLTQLGPVESGQSFMNNATSNDNSLHWGQVIVDDHLRQTNDYNSNFAKENENMENAYKFKCTPNIEQSTSFYGHRQSHPSFNGNAQSNMTFYGNPESYTPAYENETSNSWVKSNHMEFLGRKNSSQMESYDRIHPEKDHLSCLLQNGESWRPDYPLHNTVCSRHIISETGNRTDGDPEVFGYRKYYQDDSLLDARFQPSNNLSSECLLASPDGSMSPGMTSNKRFAQLGPPSTESHFLSKCIETTNNHWEQTLLHKARENGRLGESNQSVEKRALHIEINPSDDSMQLNRGRPIQEEETSQDEKASQKSSPKAKSKKSDSVESLQHQLEMMEEKRRTRTQNRSSGFRFQLPGSGEQKTESSEVASIIDVDHMISSGVTVAGFKPRAIIRKRCKNNTPTEVKNIDYWHKRRKNNDSARKSRESKKEKEKHFYKRALELEYENVYLLECLNLAEAELASLGRQFVPPPFDQSNSFY